MPSVPFPRTARLLLLLCCLLLPGLATQLHGAEPRASTPPSLQAGAATSNITPPLGELIVGNWKPIPARQVHDELHARCLVLDDGNVRLAIVLCDNVGIPTEVFQHAQQALSAHTDLAATHVLMASTHTHSATTARGRSKVIASESLTDYQRFVASRIADGVRRALEQLEPAELAWGRVEEPSEVFNRRWHVTNAALLSNPFGGLDQVRMNPPRGNAALDRPAGPTDPEVSFLSVRSREGRPIALLANYSLHYVGGVPAGDVSADYFGYFADFVAEKLNATQQTPPFVGILSNGTSGDVNNIDFVNKRTRRYAPYEKMQEVAQKVAGRVAEAHETLTFHHDISLDAARTDLTLRVRKPTPEMQQFFAKVTAEDSPDRPAPHSRTMIYAERIAQLEDAPPTVDVPLQALRIGEGVIHAIPFETFAEMGLELKDRSPFAHTMNIELANGSFGYLPTPRQHRLGGYETWLGTNYVEKNASTKITQTLLNLLDQRGGEN